ncbi:hypothetical protein ACQ4PT_041561 [Festuca glaucescens]
MAMDLLDIPLPNLFEQLLGEDEDGWPPEARFLVAAHGGNVGRLKEIARRLDTNGRRGVNATVAATTYRGMNALHAAVGGLGKLAVCRYLVGDVGMDVNMWDTSPSKKTLPWSTPCPAATCLPSGSFLTMVLISIRKMNRAPLFLN